MDDLELQQLVRSIQASPDRRDRVVRKQIDRLLTEVSRRLQGAKGALISRYSGVNDIESIVAEAIDNTMLEAMNHLDRYAPNRAAFITWINGILRFRFLDSLAKYGHSATISFDEAISEDNPTSKAEIEANKKREEEEEAKTQACEMKELAVKLRRFIKEDPEGHFASNHIRNKPDATFQQILLMRLERMTWQQIADRFNISSLQTVKSFHVRELCTYNEYFRINLREYWYR